jgi:hypothetical protein
MRISSAVFIAAVLCAPPVSGRAQSPAIATRSQAAPAEAPVAAASSSPAAISPEPAPAPPPVALIAPSGILRPSLNTVQQTLESLRVDKWKRGNVRDEASTDISSILQEMQVNLPPILKDADATPGTLSKTLTVARHVGALYDVLLRVVETARMSAPDEQANQLRQALSTLGDARLALDNHMLETAAAEEKQIGDLRVTVQRQAAFKCPALPPAPVCPQPPAKKVVKKKPQPAPATAPQTSPQKPATPQTSPQKQTTPPVNGSTPKTVP